MKKNLKTLIAIVSIALLVAGAFVFVAKSEREIDISGAWYHYDKVCDVELATSTGSVSVFEIVDNNQIIKFGLSKPLSLVKLPGINQDKVTNFVKANCNGAINFGVVTMKESDDLRFHLIVNDIESTNKQVSHIVLESNETFTIYRK